MYTGEQGPAERKGFWTHPSSKRFNISKLIPSSWILQHCMHYCIMNYLDNIAGGDQLFMLCSDRGNAFPPQPYMRIFLQMLAVFNVHIGPILILKKAQHWICSKCIFWDLLIWWVSCFLPLSWAVDMHFRGSSWALQRKKFEWII